MSTPSSGASSAIDRTLSIDPVDLFPTLIWQARLTGLAPLFPGWAAAAQAGVTLAQPPFNELHGALRACCQYAFGQMGQQGRSFTLQARTVLHRRGGFEFPHIEAGGALLSGLVDLQTPPASGRLVFRDPRPGAAYANASQDIPVAAEAGLVLIFPPWLERYVEPHGSDTPRIAISFNAV